MYAINEVYFSNLRDLSAADIDLLLGACQDTVSKTVDDRDL
jgi:hypothetical protein